MRSTLLLLACIELAGCAAAHSRMEEDVATTRGELISFLVDPKRRAHDGFSAFDGDVHVYQLLANVPSTASIPSQNNSDPVDPSSLTWRVDDAFVRAQADAEIDGAILLTTKQAGATTINVKGTTLSGSPIEDTSSLTISEADPVEWKAGDARYVAATTEVDTPPSSDAKTNTSTCELPFKVFTTTACANCHGESGSTDALTPEETAGYSDDDLIRIFTTGWKPPDYSFESNLLKTVPMPDCVFEAIHSLKIDDPTKRGLVWKVRSIRPRSLATK